MNTVSSRNPSPSSTVAVAAETPKAEEPPPIAADVDRLSEAFREAAIDPSNSNRHSVRKPII
jgi:hypothetical protein